MLEYLKRGGDYNSDKTKIIVCFKMLPQTALSDFKLP